MMAAAAEVGALAGGATPAEASAMRRFGYQLGMAFQIQDDLLDITGGGKTFGKRIGGDIIEGKKTYPLLAALGKASGEDRRVLRSIRPAARVTGARIAQVRAIYERTGALKGAEREIAARLARAKAALRTIRPEIRTAPLTALADALLGRRS